MALLAVNFHYVRPRFDAPFAGIHGLTPTELRSQLETLSRVGEFVSRADVSSALQGTRALPQRAILITFDDGLDEQHRFARPVLDEMGIPGLYFVNTSCIDGASLSTVHALHLLRAHTPPDELWSTLRNLAAGDGVKLELEADENACRQYPYDAPEVAHLKYLLNIVLDPDTVARWAAAALPQLGFDPEEAARRLYMSREQVQDLGRRGELGAHGHRHLALGRLDRKVREIEVLRCVAELRRLCPGTTIDAFSYPYGGRQACPPDAAPLLEAAGARFALTTERALNSDLEDPFFLARFSANDVPGGSAYPGGGDFFSAAPERTWFRSTDGRGTALGDAA